MPSIEKMERHLHKCWNPKCRNRESQRTPLWQMSSGLWCGDCIPEEDRERMKENGRKRQLDSSN